MEVHHAEGDDLDNMTHAELAKEAESLAKFLTESAAQQKENDGVLFSERSGADVHMFGIGSPDVPEDVH